MNLFNKPPKKNTDVQSVDACSGETGCSKPSFREKSKASVFSMKSRYNLGKLKKEIPQKEEEIEAHMNVRDLGAEPGEFSRASAHESNVGSNDKEKYKKLELNSSKIRSYFNNKKK